MLTRKNRRFLIVWSSICSFALLCNIGPIEGQIKESDYYIYLFSNNGEQKGFWPFSTKFTDEFVDDGLYSEYYLMTGHTNHGFNGFFNGFDYLEFFVYSLIGLAILFVPKAWK